MHHLSRQAGLSSRGVRGTLHALGRPGSEVWGVLGGTTRLERRPYRKIPIAEAIDALEADLPQRMAVRRQRVATRWQGSGKKKLPRP
jgi:hypothetical protein